MRLSHYLLATHKEIPHNAELISHQLMLRAGMMRKLSTGLYTFLPLGLKVLKKIEAIVREEMNRTGALEILMPNIQPRELWQETTRWETFGAQLLKIKDRAGREFCYGPTHEEVITDLMRRELKSYKQLPLNLYQIQTKFRDEIRPRFGVMRAREFIMKDAYSFHSDKASLAHTYKLMYHAYSRIFERIGLSFRAVEADTGSIGGSDSHEFQVLADSGEDKLFYSTESDYAANVEKAAYLPPHLNDRPSPSKDMQCIDTPNQKTIDAVAQFLKVPKEKTIKTLIVESDNDDLIALVLRGDHDLNELMAEKLPGVKTPLAFASEEKINAILNAPLGSIGPVGLNIPVYVDHSASVLANFVCGANQKDKHFMHANWQRDANYKEAVQLRNVIEGDLSPCGKGTLQSCRGIEVGHIFQLGNKYSVAMNATCLDEKGETIYPEMGCYGIGVSRIIAASIEQNHDEAGIIWPKTIAPFDIILVPMNMHKSQKVREATEQLYSYLCNKNYEVLLDDRNERAGVMFKDSELIGIPHRIVIGEKGLTEQCVEYKKRDSKETQKVALNNLHAFLTSML